MSITDVLFKKPYKYFKRAVFEKPFDFRSRASRSEFWYFVLGLVYLSLVVHIFLLCKIGPEYLKLNKGMAIFNIFLYPISGIVDLIIGIIFLIPTLSVGARRYHDCNQSTAFFITLYVLSNLCFFAAIALLSLTDKIPVILTTLAIAIIISLIMLYFFIKPPTPGENKYGPQPED